ncbi:MAG TPA: acyltransferase [Burkholderiales bacterium]|nr:acyltransferase [Burkholderiales bacterium]
MRRFVALDSWRGVAACLVALFHLDAYSHFHDVPFLRNAWLFVDFFFVLSGFVIAANYQQRLLEGFGVGRFLFLRLGRLYPLHLAMLALFVGVELLKVLRRMAVPADLWSLNPVAPFSTPQDAPATVLANLLLVQSLHVFDFLTWNVPSWSISTEFTTYAIFAACLVALRKRAWIALALALTAGPALIALLSERNMATVYDWGIVRCVYGFAAGVLAWHVYSRSGERLRKLSGSAVELATLALAVAFVSAAGTGPLSIAAPYVFALVVLVFACESGIASAVLRMRPFVFLGTVSYSIYMTHAFIERRLRDAAYAIEKHWHVSPFTVSHVDGRETQLLGTQPWQGDVTYVAYLAMVVAVSYFTYRWIEEPGREWARRRASRRGPRAAQPAPGPAGDPAPGGGPLEELSR